MTAALLGAAGIVVAALLGYLGVITTGRAPAHLADVEGLKTLADEYRADHAGLRAQVTVLEKTVDRLEKKVDDLQVTNARLRTDAIAAASTIAVLRAQLRDRD